MINVKKEAFKTSKKEMKKNEEPMEFKKRKAQAQLVITKAFCRLLERAYDFNHRKELIIHTVPLLNCSNQQVPFCSFYSMPLLLCSFFFLFCFLFFLSIVSLNCFSSFFIPLSFFLVVVQARALTLNTVTEVIRIDTAGEATLEMVRLISKIVKDKGWAFFSTTLTLLVSFLTPLLFLPLLFL
jgi:hypothetical protein